MMGLVVRLLFKAMIPLTIVFGVMFYLMYLNGQDPTMVFRGFGQRILSTFSNMGESVTSVPDKVEATVAGDARTFYKWQDNSGAWFYGEDPPAGALSVTAITLRLTDNVVPAFKEPEPEVVEEEEKEEEIEKPTLSSPYSPEQIDKLFEDTKQLQETISERQRQTDELLGIHKD